MEIKYIKGRRSKVWEFEKEQQAKYFYNVNKKQLLKSEYIYRTPGEGIKFFIKVNDKDLSNPFFIFKRWNNRFLILEFYLKYFYSISFSTQNHIRSGPRLVNFQNFFEALPPSVKKDLMFNLDIFI